MEGELAFFLHRSDPRDKYFVLRLHSNEFFR